MILFLAKYQFPVAFAFMQEINLAEQKPYTRKEKKSFPPSCISAENPSISWSMGLMHLELVWKKSRDISFSLS